MEELIKALKEHLYHEPVKLANTGQSDYYVDVKEAIGDPYILNLVADEMYNLLDPKPTCIIGRGYGSDFVPVLASRHGLQWSMIRDKPKNHGRNKRLIEHYFPTSKDTVIVLDDVLSSGKSIFDTGNIISNETEAKIIGFYVVVKRGELKVKLSAPLKYLIEVEDLLK